MIGANTTSERLAVVALICHIEGIGWADREMRALHDRLFVRSSDPAEERLLAAQRTVLSMFIYRRVRCANEGWLILGVDPYQNDDDLECAA